MCLFQSPVQVESVQHGERRRLHHQPIPTDFCERVGQQTGECVHSGSKDQRRWTRSSRQDQQSTRVHSDNKHDVSDDGHARNDVATTDDDATFLTIR